MALAGALGVLNAGNFGVSQTHKRTFIWFVAPGNELPQWPAPLHVFHSPQLTIKLPGGIEVGPPSEDGIFQRGLAGPDKSLARHMSQIAMLIRSDWMRDVLCDWL